MRRTDEDQAIIERGKLGIEFQKTEWSKDLNVFLDSKIAELKDSVVMLTLRHDFENAKLEAQKMIGYSEVKKFIISDAYEAMQDLIANENATKEYNAEIPNHV